VTAPPARPAPRRRACARSRGCGECSGSSARQRRSTGAPSVALRRPRARAARDARALTRARGAGRPQKSRRATRACWGATVSWCLARPPRPARAAAPPRRRNRTLDHRARLGSDQRARLGSRCICRASRSAPRGCTGAPSAPTPQARLPAARRSCKVVPVLQSCAARAACTTPRGLFPPSLCAPSAGARRVSAGARADAPRAAGQTCIRRSTSRPPLPPSCTDWTRLVLLPVLTGHVSSLPRGRRAYDAQPRARGGDRRRWSLARRRGGETLPACWGCGAGPPPCPSPDRLPGHLRTKGHLRRAAVPPCWRRARPSDDAPPARRTGGARSTRQSNFTKPRSPSAPATQTSCTTPRASSRRAATRARAPGAARDAWR